MFAIVICLVLLMCTLTILTFTARPVCLCGVSSPVVVLGLFVRLS